MPWCCAEEDQGRQRVVQTWLDGTLSGLLLRIWCGKDRRLLIKFVLRITIK